MNSQSSTAWNPDVFSTRPTGKFSILPFINGSSPSFGLTRGFHTSRSKRAFSLIELLVVIVVISILMVLIIPSISSMGGAAKLTTAGNLTVDMINQARQVARARNTKTMIAMIVSGTDAGRAVTTLAFSVTDGTWSQIDRWRNFPDGILIDTN